jgi:hypothetical protein
LFFFYANKRIFYIKETQKNTSFLMPQDNTSSPEKNYTQAEVDAVVQARIDAATAAVKTQFEGVDVTEYQRLKAEDTKRAEESLLAKGQYEQLLANTVKEKDTALETLSKESFARESALLAQLERSEVDAKLLAAAGKSHSPDQVAALIRGSIKFDAKTGVSVVDAQGNIVSKNGKPITVKEHVAAFLETNPHFLPATPGGAGSQGSVSGSQSDDAQLRQLQDEAEATGNYSKVVSYLKSKRQ